MPRYYHPEMLLHTNGHEMDYATFLKMHEDVYQTGIEYQIRYDEETFLEQGDKLAGRFYITTSKPGEEPKELEVILIAQYREGKTYRLWELVYPDWSKLEAFESWDQDF